MGGLCADDDTHDDGGVETKTRLHITVCVWTIRRISDDMMHVIRVVGLNLFKSVVQSGSVNCAI